MNEYVCAFDSTHPENCGCLLAIEALMKIAELGTQPKAAFIARKALAEMAEIKASLIKNVSAASPQTHVKETK